MNKELLEILLEMSEKSLCDVGFEMEFCAVVHCRHCILRCAYHERTYPETIKVIVNE